MTIRELLLTTAIVVLVGIPIEQSIASDADADDIGHDGLSHSTRAQAQLPSGERNSGSSLDIPKSPPDCAPATPKEMRYFCGAALASGSISAGNAGDCTGWTSPNTFGILPSNPNCKKPPADVVSCDGSSLVGRPFASSSAWNTPISGSPTIDPNSSAIVATLNSAGRAAIADIYEFGVPIYCVDNQKKRYRVVCTENWGPCSLTSDPAPLDANMRPSSGSDGAMSVVDLGNRKTYDFWQYRWSGGSPSTSWGGVCSIDGNGNEPNCPGVGAGVSRLAGVVLISEIKAGQINHALVFSSMFSKGPRDGNNFRYPAIKTDGLYDGNGAIEEGARIQLDPSINCDSIQGAGSGEKAVCHALQKYGAYDIDVGGAPIALIFETPREGNDPYASAGMSWDYYAFTHIPWNKLRVIASGKNGSS